MDASLNRRAVLTALAAGTLSTAAGPLLARPPLDGEVERRGESLRLTWNAAGPTSVLVSSDPDATRARMRILEAGARGGEAAVSLPVAPRPYFLLATADGAQARIAERLLPLEGGRNFRDLGGYRSVDGRQVRWGRIFRSGVMSDLTSADLRYLRGLGVGVICDLRSRQERAKEPNPFLAAGDVPVIATDYDMSSLMGQRARPTTARAYVDGMADSYVGLTDRSSVQYTDMFARLVRGEAPLAFNCSGGKDRTGIAAALILSVLGVPRASVLHDYALTGVYLPKAEIMKQLAAGGSKIGLTADQAKALMDVPPQVQAVMFSTDPVVMAEALRRMDRQFGGPVELAKQRFGLDDAKIARMRQLYLI